MQSDHKEKKKTVILSASLVLVLGLIFVLMLSGRNKSTLDIDENAFAISSESKITEINLVSTKQQLQFRSTDRGWLLNGRTPVDEEMSELLLKVLAKVKVSKPVSSKKAAENFEKLSRDGVNVKVISGGQSLVEYTAIPYSENKRYTVAIQAEEKTPYLVSVPGFENNLADLLNLKELDWKDRIIFSSSMRSLLSVNIDYAEGEDLSINFDKGNFNIAGTNSPDSAKLFNYLSRFQNYRIGAYLNEKEDMIVDSLKLSKPFCKISVRDIDFARSQEIVLFSFRDKQPLVYGKSLKTEEYFLIPVQYIRPLLKRNAEFRK